MPHRPRPRRSASRELPKCPTGIRGLDKITGGGLPRGRSTLVCGGAGSGKTLLGVEFLVKGARNHGEPGVLVAFEERAADIVADTDSLHFKVKELVARKQLLIEHVRIDRADILETGEYNLDGLFVRIGAAIDAVGARRVVLDTIEALFAGLSNPGIVRSELRRLFGWLKDRGVTTVVTGERGEGRLTRHGLEEYVSDCVILLDQRVTEQIATRRLRIVKYRGAAHGTNEYPFLIDGSGFLVLPITELTLDYAAPATLVPTGIAALNAMLDSKGYFRASAVLVSGTAGTGKSSVAAHLVDAACRRGERCLYFAFEEPAAQIVRNMRSIGLDLGRWTTRRLLRVHAARPATFGLEKHIGLMLQQVQEFRPKIVVVDPASSFESAGTAVDARAMLSRLVDVLKGEGITVLFTSLTSADEAEATAAGLSSMIDTWILLRILERDGERSRALYVLKARGMRHSNQVRELLITDQGLRLEPIAVGPDGVLTGSARSAQVQRDHAAATLSHDTIVHEREDLARRQKALKARIAEMEATFATEAHGIRRTIAQEQARQKALAAGRAALARERGGNSGRAPS